jgi:hypothetical protein
VTFSLRAATAARALGIYFFILVCSLAAAAFLLVEAAIEAPSVKPDAEAKITFMASVEVVSPEQSPKAPTEPGGVPPLGSEVTKIPDRNRLSEASALAVDPDGRGLTVQATAVLPPRDSLIGNGEAASERLLPQRAAVWNANRSTVDGYPISRDLHPPSGTASDGLIATQQDTLDQTSAAAAAPTRRSPERKARSTSRYSSQPASRRRLAPALPPGATAGMASPMSPDLVGCQPGSDPRWSGPDGAGASVLICNPYYRRVAVQAY